VIRRPIAGAAHAGGGVSEPRLRGQSVAQPLIIPLSVIVLDQSGHGAPKMGPGKRRPRHSSLPWLPLRQRKGRSASGLHPMPITGPRPWWTKWSANSSIGGPAPFIARARFGSREQVEAVIRTV
jgi:hypothetical protein